MMKTLVVYDSLHGNTEKVARSIGDAIAGEVRVLRSGEVKETDLEALDLLIVGAPTHGGRPMPATREFLDGIQKSALDGVSVAAFDTRLANIWARLFGFAAPRIARKLKSKGGTLIGSHEGFFVEGGKGPLSEGELERAASWAQELVESMG
jgi:flavodoxin